MTCDSCERPRWRWQPELSTHFATENDISRPAEPIFGGARNHFWGVCVAARISFGCSGQAMVTVGLAPDRLGGSFDAGDWTVGER